MVMAVFYIDGLLFTKIGIVDHLVNQGNIKEFYQ